MPELNFAGKSAIWGHHLGVPFRALKIDKKASLSLPAFESSKNDATRQQLKKSTRRTQPLEKEGAAPHLQDNLIIQGDNLQALKSLLPYYEGRVKCIYIDPPYNTGKEGWVYNDNLKSPLVKSWLGQAVGVDDMQRHDKWCCMMWPRLQLLKDLLSDDGAIFVSIDDNEQHNLRSIMNEIFGEENFISQIIIKSNRQGRNYGSIALMHEYVLVYSKKENSVLNLVVDPGRSFPYADDKGPFGLQELRNRNVKFNDANRPNLCYPIYVIQNSKDENNLYDISLKPVKNSIKVMPLKSRNIQTVWRWGQEMLAKHLNSQVRAKKKTDGTFMIVKKCRSDLKRERSIWDEKDVRSEYGTLSLKEIFSDKSLFEYPKSPSAIKRLIDIGTDKNSIVLDSFAGSGTTAQAVLELNKHDGGDRKFILVECEEYAKKITAERVRRVIRGVPKAKSEVLRKGLGGSFTYCTLDKAFDEEKFLTGEWKPTRAALSRYIFHTATGEVLKKFEPSPDFYVGRKQSTGLFVVYKPGLDFLRSSKAALTLENQELMLKRMKHDKLKKAYVFAMACFVPPEDLHNIHFCQIPFAIHEAIGRHAT